MVMCASSSSLGYTWSADAVQPLKDEARHVAPDAALQVPIDDVLQPERALDAGPQAAIEVCFIARGSSRVDC